MRELKRLHATRIMASKEALDAAIWPEGSLVLRFAQDEAFVMPPVSQPDLSDPYAIVIEENGFAGVWVEPGYADSFLRSSAEWQPPSVRPTFTQGAIAGIPAKVYFEEDRVLIITRAPYTHDFEERMP